ncbi:MFS transporter [Pseudonocardia hydrocarbonoxydans]|uniref:MFS transporter n=1 Tax=Pseudonocardia hydrocarbonoxydans TaxID=76726 RepID=A0A4Y3WIQ7_9PSEU|nr:MFS transporter [Pseudonocardia hydrocarbonoxydans]GEC18817.1 MFS transporter [Pseudonocardia hydrocarbonoxydans]
MTPPVSRPAVVIGVLASCGFAVSLMQTLVVPLLPQFPRLLGSSTSTVTWLVTATLVAGAVCAPVLGRLGDMYGKRRMLLVALGLVTAGSALGAVAPGIELLLVARVLQGASLGVVALGISVMRDVLPPGRVGGGIALMSSSLGIGGAVGLPLTGAVAQQASWRWLFAGAAVLGALQFLLVRRTVAESPSRSGGRFDVPGAVGLSVALVCLLLAISKGSDWGWTSPAVIGLLATAVVVFAAWGRLELRTPSPLVDLRTTARPAVLWTNLGSILIGFSMFAGFLVTTQLLQAPVESGYGFGLPLVAAGLVLLPIGGAMALFSPVSARLSARFGARTTLVAGTVVLAVGNLAMAVLPDSIALVMAAATVTAIGAALAYSALPLLIMAAVPPTETAAANSLNTLMRMLGTSSCSAVVAAVATGLTITVGGAVLPAAAAYTVVFLAAAGAGVLAAVIAALTPHATPVAAPPTPVPAAA